MLFITEKQIPWYVLFDYFITRLSFKNLNVAFLTKWPQMLKVYQCQHTFGICGHLVKKGMFKFLKDGLVIK